MRLRRPSARLSELAFTAVAAGMLSWLAIILWPAPALDVSPAWCQPLPTLPAPVTFKPQSGDRLGGLPPSFERQDR